MGVLFSSESSEPTDSLQKVIVRELTPRDADGFRMLRLNCIKHDPYSFSVCLEEERCITHGQIYSMLVRFCHCSASKIWGAFIGEQLIGMIGLETLLGNVRQHRGIVTSLCVLPEYRGSGIGRVLVEVLIEHVRNNTSLRTLVLEVSATSTAAIRLYEEQGFMHNGIEYDALCYDGVYVNLYRMNLDLTRDA
ncbi:Ribosomal protein S18 acetylase RimI [Oceanospirillum multiglobuliferum]|uniref:N-acetyltransferase domain-containing protein n=1 Tax=Oceanospirillum multiglobuliferum TaxID=64969 RepID=A0A1T4N7R9_9GAMM|nr:GNAT family N-acetyltransferase [Oceanospirillum multiglobuliferum]OPX55857.1 hypothetical protein BTE48_06570 [Oceanospirillum multiglobuliferum]SJZ74878.1 Ribosomal protein S18 acetylase RimI [Oceanospirillum multiglobuliferum]